MSSSLASPHGGMVLHMHFNWALTWMNAFWFLDETDICSPWNFVACMFVSDWLSDDQATTMFFEEGNGTTSSRQGLPVIFRHCEANGKGPRPGWYMYMCFADSLRQAASLPGALGVFFLADDAVPIRPWRDLRSQFLLRGSMVLPGTTEVPNTCNLLEGRGKMCDTLGLESERERVALLLTLHLLGSDSTATKAMGDVAYVPLHQAQMFVKLAELFYSHEVFEEFALPAIAQALESHVARSINQTFYIHDLWHQRDDALEVLARHNGEPNHMISTPFWEGPSSMAAFVHPVKIGLTFKHQHAVKDLYSKVFAYP